MSGTQLELEAHWRLAGGPLMEKSVLMELFGAIGMVKEIDPHAYDMNRRGKWRSYSGPRMVVDALTQRTQLMEIVEDESIEKGGSQVLIEMGKQGRQPSASMRWQTEWPPTTRQRHRWEEAVKEAFQLLSLEEMTIVGSRSMRDGQVPVWLGAVSQREGDEARALVKASQGEGQPLDSADMVGRAFWTTEAELPQRWIDWWARKRR